MLHTVQDPLVRHKVRRVGVSHVTKLTHHHRGHPGDVGELAPAPGDQLPQVCSCHSTLGADVDWS